MRKFLIGLWLLLPVAAWAYHEGPGQERLQLDAVDVELEKAQTAADKEDWKGAIAHFDAAIKELPKLDSPERMASARRIRLSSAKAKLQASQLIEARDELKDLITEIQDDETVPADAAERSELLDEARAAHANSQYYYTWLMRLEGYPRTDWEPEVEVARQTYRLLAEEAEERGDSKVAVAHMEDLEATVKLARLDLEELQGLPLPSQ